MCGDFMNKTQKYFFNAFLLSLASLVMRGVAVSFNVYVTSKVGAQGMGLLTLCGGVYGFCITFATSGINMAVVRLVSSALPDDNLKSIDKNGSMRVRKIMLNALFYCLFFGLVATVVLYTSADAIAIFLLKDERATYCLKLMAFSLLPISICSALNGYFYAVRRVYKNVISQLCEQGFKIFVVTALLITIAPKGLEYACVAVVAGGALAEGLGVLVSSILYLFDRRLHYKKIAKNGDNVSKIDDFDTRVVPIALPVAISAYVRSALSTAEHLLIPWGFRKNGVSSASAMASYGVLHGMVVPLLLFPSAILGAFSSLLVPELSSALAGNDELRIKRIVSRVFDTSLLFSLGVSGAFICFSGELGLYIYNSEIASHYIRLLAPLIPLMYLDGAVDSMLKGLGHQLYTMRVNIVDSLLSVLLILVLLPSFGIKGYVAVIFITELVNTSFSILRLLSVTNVKAYVIKWVLKPIFAIILATCISRLVFNLPFFKLSGGKLFTLVELGFTGVLYLVISYIIGSISKRDLSFFKGIFKGKRVKK